jgi:hypothetical protein
MSFRARRVKKRRLVVPWSYIPIHQSVRCILPENINYSNSKLFNLCGQASAIIRGSKSGLPISLILLRAVDLVASRIKSFTPTPNPNFVHCVYIGSKSTTSLPLRPIIVSVGAAVERVALFLRRFDGRDNSPSTWGISPRHEEN